MFPLPKKVFSVSLNRAITDLLHCGAVNPTF